MNNPNDGELHSRLLALSKGYFIRDGKIYEIIDMQGRGSDIDKVVSANENDPAYAQEMAAYRLLQILELKCKDGEPHRMRLFPAVRKCVECGRTE